MLMVVNIEEDDEDAICDLRFAASLTVLPLDIDADRVLICR